MTPTETLIQTLSQTPKLAEQLQASLQRLKDDNDQIIEVLTYSKTVADELDQLDDALKTISDLLTVVSVIPEVGQAASALRTSINLLSKEVTPARQAADKIESTVKPLREGLQKLASVLDLAIQTTGKIQSVSQTFLEQFTAVAACIDGLPAGKYKEQGQQYLEAFSKATEPAVADLNTALGTANGVIEEFYSKLSQLQQELEPLRQIAAAVEDVLKVLCPLLEPLQELKNALMTIQIVIPIPYPHLVSLYDVFVNFGAYIDLALKPIEELVNDLLKALNITLPSIPGLSDLLHLNIDVPVIPDFTALLSAITAPFEKIHVAITHFNLKCPPAEGDTAPTWPG